MRQLADWWNQSEELEDIVCIDIELFRMLKSAWVKSNKIILVCIKSAFFSPHYKFSTSRSSNTHTHTNLFVQLDFEKSYPNQTNFNAQSNWKSECICLSAFVLFVMQIFCARTHTHTPILHINGILRIIRELPIDKTDRYTFRNTRSNLHIT